MALIDKAPINLDLLLGTLLSVDEKWLELYIFITLAKGVCHFCCCKVSLLLHKKDRPISRIQRNGKRLLCRELAEEKCHYLDCSQFGGHARILFHKTMILHKYEIQGAMYCISATSMLPSCAKRACLAAKSHNRITSLSNKYFRHQGLKTEENLPSCNEMVQIICSFI